jgi:hypothetical protein
VQRRPSRRSSLYGRRSARRTTITATEEMIALARTAVSWIDQAEPRRVGRPFTT